MLEGTGLFKVGDEETKVTGGNILIVPPDTPHKFINTGNILLRQIDIHLNEKFITNWLDS